MRKDSRKRSRKREKKKPLQVYVIEPPPTKHGPIQPEIWGFLADKNWVMP